MVANSVTRTAMTYKPPNLTGSNIVGFLTTPKYFPLTPVTNVVTAQVQAISGSAVEKPPSKVSDMAFKYLLTSEVIPILSISTNLYGFAPPVALTDDERNLRSNQWVQAQN